mmetsp:Transcript_10342/g.35125  ORF Transcript_10342/g.35125 Transcript_10342/m.35125 type:complete len:320 (-) Transcript_10342:73-1032(-)
MIGRLSVDRVLALGHRHLRVIPADRVEFGGMARHARRRDLFELSEPAAAGTVDAFVSHSWRDDTDAKWQALRAWCRAFELKHGRPARLWHAASARLPQSPPSVPAQLTASCDVPLPRVRRLDHYCIDPEAVPDCISALPVFIASCNRFLALAGPTWTSRLWCAVELFTFLEMGGDEHHAEVLVLDAPGPGRAPWWALPPWVARQAHTTGAWRPQAAGVAHLPTDAVVVGMAAGPPAVRGDPDDDRAPPPQSFSAAVRAFDARLARCAYEEDRVALLAIIAHGFPRIEDFNTRVREVLERVLAREGQAGLARQRLSSGHA